MFVSLVVMVVFCRGFAVVCRCCDDRCCGRCSCCCLCLEGSSPPASWNHRRYDHVVTRLPCVTTKQNDTCGPDMLLSDSVAKGSFASLSCRLKQNSRARDE